MQTLARYLYARSSVSEFLVVSSSFLYEGEWEDFDIVVLIRNRDHRIERLRMEILYADAVLEQLQDKEKQRSEILEEERRCFRGFDGLVGADDVKIPKEEKQRSEILEEERNCYGGFAETSGQDEAEHCCSYFVLA